MRLTGVIEIENLEDGSTNYRKPVDVEIPENCELVLRHKETKKIMKIIG